FTLRPLVTGARGLRAPPPGGLHAGPYPPPTARRSRGRGPDHGRRRRSPDEMPRGPDDGRDSSPTRARPIAAPRPRRAPRAIHSVARPARTCDVGAAWLGLARARSPR